MAWDRAGWRWVRILRGLTSRHRKSEQKSSNQENAAYPSGLCAERVAIFQAGAIYPNAKIEKLALTAASDVSVTASPIPPCGACRQSIAEYELKQDYPIEIYFMGESGVIYKSDSLKNLLPFAFDKNFL